jgi:tetratricopeptide (TPR) repeat protein
MAMIHSTDFTDRAYAKFKKLFERGNKLVDRRKYNAALIRFSEAMALIPDPKMEWEETTWVTAAIGETYFFNRDYSSALAALNDAIKCPEGLGNPLIHLRLGQVKFEMGIMDDAADELMRAYMGAGIEIFEGEDEKYLAYLKTKAKL